jgi:hypothetical protein
MRGLEGRTTNEHNQMRIEVQALVIPAQAEIQLRNHGSGFPHSRE